MWLVLAAALLLRAGVPVGWMPVAGDDGLRIMLCGGSGPVELAADSSPHHEHAQHHAHHPPQDGQPDRGEGHRDPCPFGLALGTALDLPAPPAAIEPLFEPAPQLAALYFAADRIAAWRAERPPVRGPPAFA